MVAHAVAIEELVASAIVIRVPFAAAMAAREAVARRGRTGGCCARRVRARVLPGSCDRAFRKWTHAPSVREAVACNTAVRDVSARALAEQRMFALAVSLREVFPAVWTAHEVLARAKAVQEALSRIVPLQKVLARVLVVPEVLVRAVDGWDVFPAAVATSETIVSADRGA